MNEFKRLTSDQYIELAEKHSLEAKNAMSDEARHSLAALAIAESNIALALLKREEIDDRYSGYQDA